MILRKAGAFTVSLTDYAGGTELPWHVHEQTYLTYVLRGGFRQLLRGGTRDCGARSLIVHPAETHADRFARDARCLKIEFESAWLRSVAPLASPSVVETPVVAAVATRVARELIVDDGVSSLMLEGLALELFAAAQRQCDPSTRVPSWLREVRATVATRFFETPSLTELAARVEVHPTHLARAFRQHYGCTIGDYVRELRIEHAKRRIADGAALSDVALDCGFADQSHFARTFRRLTGLTPTEFRRAC